VNTLRVSLVALLAIGVSCDSQALLHRQAEIVCAPSGAPAGSPVSCAQDMDCDCGGFVGTGFCRGGQCSCDQCLRDEDCGSTGVCSCQGQTRGWAGSSPGNVCVPGDCRVDADCRLGGPCSPTTSFECGAFYGVEGYYCHTPADLCRSDSDCEAPAECRHNPETGTWTCASGRCAG
jgi:hypothetical protein